MNDTAQGQPAEPSIEDRIGALMLGEPKPEPKPDQAATEEESDATEAEGEQSLDQAPSPDDIPDETPIAPPPQPDLEVVHNGQTVKIPADKVVDFARQGFDYTQKTQTLAEERKAVQAMRQALQAQSQLQPQYIEAIADVRAYEKALQSFQQVNWSQKATDDPIGYTQERARYDQLQDAYKQAVGQAQAIYGQLGQLDQHTRQEMLRLEYTKAVNAVPAWKDQSKFQADAAAMREYLSEYGYGPEEIGAVTDHRHLQILRDAVAYRNLVKAKAGTQKKVANAPPVAKPGAAQTRQEIKAQADQNLTRRIKAEPDDRKREKLIAQRFAQKL